MTTMSSNIAIPDVEPFFDEDSNTYTYVVADPRGRECAVIDPVLGFDANSGRTNTDRIEHVIKFIQGNDLMVRWILETHVHADHISAAPLLQRECGGKTGIGSGIVDVQETFSTVFNSGDEMPVDGSQFDALFKDGQRFKIGDLNVRVLHTPGHTPACVSYLIGDCAFIGDTLFMPDYGTARTDFPGGDAQTLFNSIQRILSLPDDTRLFVCHDYLGSDRFHYYCESNIAEQRADNIHIGNNTSELEFIQLRESRDRKLAVPALLLPAIQVNMRAGVFPDPEDNGVAYLKIPVNKL